MFLFLFLKCLNRDKCKQSTCRVFQVTVVCVKALNLCWSFLTGKYNFLFLQGVKASSLCLVSLIRNYNFLFLRIDCNAGGNVIFQTIFCHFLNSCVSLLENGYKELYVWNILSSRLLEYILSPRHMLGLGCICKFNFSKLKHKVPKETTSGWQASL